MAIVCTFVTVSMNLGSIINVGAYNQDKYCLLENTPPPLFGLDVVYKIGGRINGTLRYMPVLQSHFDKLIAELEEPSTSI